ncbi:hypothetical protein [Natronocalculus amylovorans]|uniref:Uncharacterized protein n=1 Tax=Natronocalculus amylovorans TaxID=2917812 RepID=A0AAE3FYB8_9EURY|nr:hypothetical protein [Natronocalculus amylovorans]MCL9817554.1 hypothetical protein [Natronocalculus amylovorans]
MSEESSEPFPVELLAVPFIVGMAIGLAFGRVAFQSTAIGVTFGVLFFVMLAVVRIRLLPTKPTRRR